MELDKFHVLQGGPRIEGDGKAIPGRSKGIGCGLIDFSSPTRGQQHGFTMKGMQFSRGQLIGYKSATLTVFDDQRHHLEFVMEYHPPLETFLLLPESIQDDPPGPVGGVAGPFDRRLSKVTGMPAKCPLGDLPLLGPVEGDTQVLQLINSSRGIFSQNFDGILITQIVAALDRVKHVPFPIILLLVTQGSTNPPLCSPGMGTGSEYLAQDSHIGLFTKFNGRSQSGQSGSNNNHVVSMNHHRPLVISAMF